MSDQTPNFSIVIIARNESKRIRDCLSTDAIRGFIARGGEVVIADTGSSDDTREVARSLGAVIGEVGTKHLHTLSKQLAKKINKRFVHRPDTNLCKAGDTFFDFGEARNSAHWHASNDMVLQIDSGDRLEVLDIDFFINVIKQGVTKFNYVHYLTTGSTSQKISRFYNRQIDTWKGKSHEAVSTKPLPVGFVCATGEVIETARPQHQLDVDTTKLQVRYFREAARSRPYHIGMAMDMMEAPNDPRWYHYLGRELYYMEKWTSAIELFKYQLTMDHAYYAEKCQSACHIGECLEHLGRNEEAAMYYFQATWYDANRREPYIRLGFLYQKLEKALPDGPANYGKKREYMQRAACMAKAALAIDPVTGLYENEYNYREGPHYLLKWAYTWLGKPEKAKHHWIQVLNYTPHDTSVVKEARYYQHVKAALSTDSDGEWAIGNVQKNNAIWQRKQDEKNAKASFDDKASIEAKVSDDAKTSSQGEALHEAKATKVC